MKIIAYGKEHESLVKAFNQRLSAGGCEFAFPESHVPVWLPPQKGNPLFDAYFLALKPGHGVCGAYVLKNQLFWINKQVSSVGNLRLPLSEGIVDKRFNFVGPRLILDALKKSPMLYCLGMGGLDRPLPRMLAAMNWRLFLIPFFFKVVRARCFFKKIEALRTTPARKGILDFLAATGLGWLGVTSFQTLRSHRIRGEIRVEEVEGFDRRVDFIWEASRNFLSFSAVRNRMPLSTLYPEESERLHHLMVLHEGKTAGWVVVANTRMSNDKYFGDLRLGSIVDVLAFPGMEGAVTGGAVQYLAREKADLVVSNQSHLDYVMALKQCGFISGPSNFALALSPALTRRIYSRKKAGRFLHVNRGDGDGPIHL